MVCRFHAKTIFPILFFACACVQLPSGLKETKSGKGPMVKFDLHAKPFAEIPFPNNVATRQDPTSPTGRRLNISLDATTNIERKMRMRADQTMDGFGIFSPIMVSFDAPLDVENIRERHTKNHDFQDDCVLLVNVDPKSKGYGEFVELDLGQGNYPLGIEWPFQYWDQDEHRDSPNLLFETRDEDTNNNGVLDPYEDTDFDGVLDKPNTFSGKPVPLVTPDNVKEFLSGQDRPIDDLITFYEKETNTLIAWPVYPLREKTTYAVVLTKHLKGLDGEPVRSPFPYINHLDQTEELRPLVDLLPKIGMSLDDVQFAWSFTTQSIVDELYWIRAGLYGHGPLKFLASQYPPDLKPKVVRDKDESGHLPEKPYILPNDLALPIFDLAGPLLGYPPEVVKALKDDISFIDHWVLGEFTSPNFLVDRDGIATPMYPADDNEMFEIDLNTGRAVHGPGRVSFICAVPKETPEHHQPFPVMIYGHGFSGAPFEVFGFAGRYAQFGYAVCGLDAVGHGLALPSDEGIPYDQIVPQALAGLGLLQFYEAFKGGRIRDLDNDGMITAFDNGGDFWSYDMFHLRDNVRQTVVDHIQFIRILRSLGNLKWDFDTNGDGKADDLMGDFDGDGRIDFGGAQNQKFVVWGQSMGGIVTEVLAGVEPTISAATPISGGGGLIHIGLRTTNPGVPEGALMPLMGPFIVFSPLGDAFDSVEIAIMINDLHREYRDGPRGWPHYYPVATTTNLKPGDSVIVRNQSKGVESRAFRHPDGRGFRVSIPADALSAVEKRGLLGLRDGDRVKVPVICEDWTADVDEEGHRVGEARCITSDPKRSLLFGDHIVIEIYDGLDGKLKQVIDTFEKRVDFQGAIFPAGAPLVAIGPGLGHPRNTPDFRKTMAFAAMILEKGDPIAYARYYGLERLDFSYDKDALPQTNIIIYHSIGDANVPVSASIALARAAGILSEDKNDALLKHHVGEGVEGFFRATSKKYSVRDWARQECKRRLSDPRWPNEWDGAWQTIEPPLPLPVHVDADNLDSGVDEHGEPNIDPPIRAQRETDFGVMALRLPYLNPMGSHGVEPSNPTRMFNINNFVMNQIGVFASSDGKILMDDPCLALPRCPSNTECCSRLPESVIDIANKTPDPKDQCK